MINQVPKVYAAIYLEILLVLCDINGNMACKSTNLESARAVEKGRGENITPNHSRVSQSALIFCCRNEVTSF